jgi:hypothetical protein
MRFKRGLFPVLLLAALEIATHGLIYLITLYNENSNELKAPVGSHETG